MGNRYHRQIVLPEVGAEGQSALKSARVLVVGTGGLGGPCLQYLAAAGVGTLGLIDDDVVDLSNLQRQVLFSTDQVGVAKVFAAKTFLEKLNPNINIITFQVRLHSKNALELCEDFDIIVDGTDNFQTKYLLNDVSLVLRKPLVYGSISRFEGQVAVFSGQEGPCYRCLHPEMPKSHIGNCAQQGVFGAVPGIVGSTQALEVLKWILYKENHREDLKPLFGKFLVADFKSMQFNTLGLSLRPGCLCTQEQRSLSKQSYGEVCLSTFERTWQEYFQSVPRPLLVDVRSQSECEHNHLPDSLWETEIPRDTSLAREIYLYCNTGVRSKLRCEEFLASGYRAFSIKGGIAELIEKETLGII